VPVGGDPVVLSHGKSWVFLGIFGNPFLDTLGDSLLMFFTGTFSKTRQDTPKDWHKNDAAQMHSQ